MHIDQYVEIAEAQMKDNLYFLFEHPKEAKSWKEVASLKALRSKPGVYEVVLDQCMFGLRSQDRYGPGFAKKPTRMLTNLPGLAELLHRICPGKHRHVPLLQSRAGPATQYPQALLDTICKGLQMELDALTLSLSLCNLEIHELHEETNAQTFSTVTEHQWQDSYWDANTGEHLDSTLVGQGRRKEIDKMQSRAVYEAVPASTMTPGAPLIGTTWVDVWKLGEVRSRLCGQEFAVDARDDLFAGTPPLAIARMLVSIAASCPDFHLLAMDVSCAFLYADVEREVYIKLPKEDPRYGPGILGRLLKALYGTRDAPKLWQRELDKTMTRLGNTCSQLLSEGYASAAGPQTGAGGRRLEARKFEAGGSRL